MKSPSTQNKLGVSLQVMEISEHWSLYAPPNSAVHNHDFGGKTQYSTHSDALYSLLNADWARLRGQEVSQHSPKPITFIPNFHAKVWAWAKAPVLMSRVVIVALLQDPF
jgi:hypothetical protein